MMRALQRYGLTSLLLGGAVLPQAGCFAFVENGLNQVLSPAAYDTALSLPYGLLAPLAELVVRIL